MTLVYIFIKVPALSLMSENRGPWLLINPDQTEVIKDLGM